MRVVPSLPLKNQGAKVDPKRPVVTHSKAVVAAFPTSKEALSGLGREIQGQEAYQALGADSFYVLSLVDS